MFLGLTSLTPVKLLSADPALARPLVAVLSERRTVGPENVAQSVPGGVGVGQLGDTGENLKRVPWRDTPTTAGCGVADAAQNPNLGFVLQYTVAFIEQVRSEERTVLLHDRDWQSQRAAQTRLIVTAATALAEVRDAWARTADTP